MTSQAQLVGYLLPNSWSLSLHRFPLVDPRSPEQEAGMLSFSAQGGIFTASCEFLDGVDRSDADIRNILEASIRPFIASYALRDSSAFDFRITHIDRGSGLAQYNSFFTGLAEAAVDVDATKKHAGQNTALREALDEFVWAINRPANTALHCYRGIEAIRSACGQDGDWQGMHAALRTTREVFEQLRLAARPLRHGETPGDLRTVAREDSRLDGVPQEERRRHLSLLRAVIVRFVSYLEGDQVPLDATTPILDAELFASMLSASLPDGERSPPTT